MQFQGPAADMGEGKPAGAKMLRPGFRKKGAVPQQEQQAPPAKMPATVKSLRPKEKGNGKHWSQVKTGGK